MGLALTDYTEALEEILPLLLDKLSDARIGAIRAIAASGLPGGALALRLKALTGDTPEVTGECLAALLRSEPSKSLDFVAKFLDDRDEAVAESAALALGDSRLEGAFDILRDAFDRTHGRPLRHTLLTAIALLRRDAAVEFLREVVRDAAEPTAAAAREALSIYQP